MKIKNIGVWITTLLVFCAILISGMLSNTNHKESEKREVYVSQEIIPSAPSVPTRAPKPTTVPKPTVAPKPANTKEPSGVSTEENTEKAVTVSAPKVYTLPSSGEEARGYSDKTLVFFPSLSQWQCHLGIDFTPLDSDKVLAVADGTVEKIFTDHLFGETVCIDHGDGIKSYYASLSEISLEEGQAVSGGTEIGKMGQTATVEDGVHLHFYMEKDGKPIHPYGSKE